MHDHLPGLLAAMAEPRFYPHGVQRIEHHETHASHLFLTGQWVYKIKKPVNFGFLDYSTLEKRKTCCRAEVVLNRRLTQGVYRGVVPLTQDTRGVYAMAGDGSIVEYAVRMTQLSDQATLTHRLEAGSLKPDLIGAVARKLAAFYKGYPTRMPIQVLGSWDTVGLNCEENFSQTEAFCGHYIDGDKHNFVREATRRFMRTRRICFDHRVAQGFIKDCHGDLRCDHVYIGDQIQILDCIEFNQRFRYGDVAADLGFLTMDLDFKGAPELARHLISAYVIESDDFGIYTLLDFYKCYRAFVRCKINCFQLAQQSHSGADDTHLRNETRAYLEFAHRYAMGFSQPMLWIFCGLPATGKSTQAREVAEALQLPWLQSDFIRKKLTGKAPRDAAVTGFEGGIYTPRFTSRVYERMANLSKRYLASGRSLVLDATFSKEAQRMIFHNLATSMGIPAFWVVCEVDENILRRRLADREGGPSVSDARLDHLEGFKRSWEPLAEISKSNRININTEFPSKTLLGTILTKGYQVKDSIKIHEKQHGTDNRSVSHPPPPRRCHIEGLTI